MNKDQALSMLKFIADLYAIINTPAAPADTDSEDN